MINTLTITISTSTEGSGEARLLMVEELEDILDKLYDAEIDKQYIVQNGDIEKRGYEVLTHYRIEIQE